MTFDMAAAWPAALGIRVAVLIATIALAKRPNVARTVGLTGSMAASLLSMAGAVAALRSPSPVSGILVQHVASGLSFTYAIAPLSAWFLITFDLIAALTAWYSLAYFAHAIAPARTTTVSAAFVVLPGAVDLVFGANDVITLLFGWELMTLATTALVATEYESRQSRRAAYLYLVMSHVGTACLIVAGLVLAGAGHAVSFDVLLTGHVVPPATAHLLFGLCVIGFGVKAGIMPLHVWLPEAHPAAPSSVSALMSAVLISAGIYGIVRVGAFGLGVPDVRWGLTCMGLGMVSALLGVLYALAQVDLKRLLAYSTIENTGLMLLAIGAGMVALSYGHPDLAGIAFAAALLHLLNHAIFKALLFLGAGSVAMATATRHLEHLGGLIRSMPWTAVTFIIGAMAIAALPMLNGFPGEWLAFQALAGGFHAVSGWQRLMFPLGVAVVGLSAALAATSSVRAFGLCFLALPRSRAAADAHESPWTMLAPMAGLAGLCVVLGLAPGLAMAPLERVLASLPGVSVVPSTAAGAVVLSTGTDTMPANQLAPLWWAMAAATAAGGAAWLAGRARVRRTATWGCGGALTPQTEYTATAFSKPLLIAFRAVYRPTREVEALAEVSPYFPREVRFRARIEPTFERYLYAPLARIVLRTASGLKVLQAGSLHAYLAYVLAIIVLLLVWLGGLV